jgi:hypothetical protein
MSPIIRLWRCAFIRFSCRPKPKSVPIVPRLRFVPDVPIVYRVEDSQGRLPRFRNCENVEIRGRLASAVCCNLS